MEESISLSLHAAAAPAAAAAAAAPSLGADSPLSHALDHEVALAVQHEANRHSFSAVLSPDEMAISFALDEEMLPLHEEGEWLSEEMTHTPWWPSAPSLPNAAAAVYIDPISVFFTAINELIERAVEPFKKTVLWHVCAPVHSRLVSASSLSARESVACMLALINGVNEDCKPTKTADGRAVPRHLPASAEEYVSYWDSTRDDNDVDGDEAKANSSSELEHDAKETATCIHDLRSHFVASAASELSLSFGAKDLDRLSDLARRARGAFYSVPVPRQTDATDTADTTDGATDHAAQVPPTTNRRVVRRRRRGDQDKSETRQTTSCSLVDRYVLAGCELVESILRVPARSKRQRTIELPEMEADQSNSLRQQEEGKEEEEEESVARESDAVAVDVFVAMLRLYHDTHLLPDKPVCQCGWNGHHRQGRHRQLHLLVESVAWVWSILARYLASGPVSVLNESGVLVELAQCPTKDAYLGSVFHATLVALSRRDGIDFEARHPQTHQTVLEMTMERVRSGDRLLSFDLVIDWVITNRIDLTALHPGEAGSSLVDQLASMRFTHVDSYLVPLGYPWRVVSAEVRARLHEAAPQLRDVIDTHVLEYLGMRVTDGQPQRHRLQLPTTYTETNPTEIDEGPVAEEKSNAE